MHISGHGRNEIARLLIEQGLHVSEGSVGNIVRAYRQHELPLKSDATISTGVDMNNTGSPSSIAQLGVGTKPTTSSNVVTPKNGGPLSHLLVNMTDSPIEPTLATITNSVTPPTNPEELDFSDNPYPESYPNPDSHVDNMQVNIESDIDDKYVIKETEEIEEASEESNQPQSSIRNSENQSTLGIDWDSEEAWDRRFVRIIMNDKKERQQEFQLLEQERQRLNEEREEFEIEKHNLGQVIEQRENNLKTREEKVKEAAPLLPSVRELQSAGITFNTLIPYIMAINEKSALDGIDLKKAAYDMMDEIKDYRALGTLKRGIEEAKKHFEDMQNFTIQKQQALMTLMDLQGRLGFSEKEITEWVGLVATLNKSGLAHGNGYGKLKLDTELKTELVGLGN